MNTEKVFIERNPKHLHKNRIEFKTEYGKHKLEVGTGVSEKLKKGSKFYQRKVKDAYKDFTGSSEGVDDFMDELKKAESEEKDEFKVRGPFVKPEEPVSNIDRGSIKEPPQVQGSEDNSDLGNKPYGSEEAEDYNIDKAA